MEQHKIERINFLAKKSKTEGLTEPEKSEQKALREEYIAEWRTSLKTQLDNTIVLHENGTATRLQQKKGGAEH